MQLTPSQKKSERWKRSQQNVKLRAYAVRAVLGKPTMRYAHLEEVQVSQKARDVISRLANDEFKG